MGLRQNTRVLTAHKCQGKKRAVEEMQRQMKSKWEQAAVTVNRMKEINKRGASSAVTINTEKRRRYILDVLLHKSILSACLKHSHQPYDRVTLSSNTYCYTREV